MEAARPPEGSLVIRENPYLLRAILFCAGAIVVAAVALQEPRDDFRLLLGVLGSLVPFAAGMLLERVDFEFDVAQRRLRWRRSNLFRELSGELSFAEITGVELRVREEPHSGSKRRHTAPSYCVVLLTRMGEMRLSDRRYADERETTGIADAIREMLGLPSRPPVGDGVAELMARRPSHP